MTSVTSDPGQALALLPIDQNEQTERLWLQDTLSWLKSVPPERRTERLRDLARTIAGDAGIQARFQQLWTKAYAPRLFSEAALPEATSLVRELMVRVRRRLLPQVEDELDLYAALQMAELSEQDARWMEGLSDEDVAPWRELLCRPAADFPLAIRLLALRSASIGLSRSVMKVMPHQYETESPFFDLVDAAGRFARSPQLADQRERLRSIILPCRVSTTQAHQNMEDLGVSADLVFRLDLVMAQLDRIDALLRVMEGREDGRAFASMLVRAVAGESSTRSLVSNGVNRVARHIVAHTGKSGEHYIAGSQAEWIHMGYGALGAGGVTAFTALFKYVLAAAPLAPLWIGVAHSMNYTVSFVLMQFLGWSLASKMPSMTAAALSEALEKEDGMQSEVKLVAAITRTQTIVTVGNLLGAVPLALLIDAVIRWRSGGAFLSHDAALHGLESMGVTTSWTVVFAALTGGFLWCSSLCAGWTANWMVLHRLPAAIAQSRRMRRWMRPGTTVRLAELVKHHLSGIAGYTALGLMLGLLPFVSVFAGFPVEVRHITLASASVAYDVSSLAWGGKVPWIEVGLAGLGLMATGLLNFGVSFALGLWLALRARNLDTNGRRTLLVALWNQFRRHPARFLWRNDGA